MPAIKKAIIYELYDIRKPKIAMYVGKATLTGKYAPRRPGAHWRDFKAKGTATNKLLLKWFMTLKSESNAPCWRIRETISMSRWQERERHWIAYWRRRNPSLCNYNKGGHQWPESATVNSVLRGSPSLGGKKMHELYPEWGSILGKRYGSWAHVNKLPLSKRRVWMSAAGKVGGKRVHEIHPDLASSNGKLGGSKRKFHPKKSEFGRRAGLIGGKLLHKMRPHHNLILTHNRWHRDRGLRGENCAICKGDIVIQNA